jgi:hypothetical protein
LGEAGLAYLVPKGIRQVPDNIVTALRANLFFPSRFCQKTHWPDHKGLCRPENIGYPFLVSVPASRLTYARLAQLLEGYAR